MAHELKNPLTSIKGLVQVNRKEADARGLPAEDLRIIEQEIRRMERTLQTFLDFARPSQPHRRQVELAAVVGRVLALIVGRAEKQQVVVRLKRPDSPVLVEADQDQTQQLLLNLILNALDVMPRGGTLEVVLHAPRGGRVELQVFDTGPGIAPDLLPRIFDPFVSSKETGLGLGLAVSRRIAEDHGGRLAAANRPEGGACFVLTLPEPARQGAGEARSPG
jgi:two-component system sensor histidine kinase HydH